MLWSFGVDGFVQQSQTLFMSFEAYTNSIPGIYPIVTTGTSTISNPAFQLEDLSHNECRFLSGH